MITGARLPISALRKTPANRWADRFAQRLAHLHSQPPPRPIPISRPAVRCSALDYTLPSLLPGVNTPEHPPLSHLFICRTAALRPRLLGKQGGCTPLSRRSNKANGERAHPPCLLNKQSFTTRAPTLLENRTGYWPPPTVAQAGCSSSDFSES